MDEQVLESAATPEQQKAAEKMGWIPPARFKGDVARFVDAAEYIKRGEEVLPIVREQLKTTRGELERVTTAQRATENALKAAQAAIDDMEARHTVQTQKAVDQAKRDVKAALAKANEAGDHEAVAELTEQMVELNAQPAEAPAKKDEKPAAPQPSEADLRIARELKDWHAENRWFKADDATDERTIYAMGVAQALRACGDTSQGRLFFDKVSEAVEKHFTLEDRPGDDKVEGTRGGATGASRQSGKKGFAALPSDAKEACKADTRRFVGEGKRFKTADEWRNYYAEVYFREEAR